MTPDLLPNSINYQKSSTVWIQIWALLFTSCKSLGKLLCASISPSIK